MLIDKIRVNVKSGKGGDGAVRFFKNRKPSGGIGGDGGNVYLEGTKNIYDLKPLLADRLYKADDGEPGGGNTRTGANGKDMIIRVPLTTIVYSLENEEIVRIDKDGQKELLVKGGRGGLGNHEFRRGQESTRKKFTRGVPGQEMKLFFELNLYADVLFIGFPNAGKSSMLNALTNASVAVAPYPFTTLTPHLGVAENLILMDLPGLIEGTYEGKGLGTRFVKHTRKAKLVAHFVSMENEDVLETYTKMREELKNINLELYEKPEVILLTKSDMFTEQEIRDKTDKLKKNNSNILACSAFKLDELKDVINLFHTGMKK